MAVCGSCDARDGERIRSRELSRTGLARVCGDLRLSGGWVGRRRCRQAGSGMARSRAKARLNFSAQGQRSGRCRVNRRAERVSRPAREKNRRRRVLVVAIRSPRPIRAVQRARLWAIVWTASQAPLAAKRPEGRWFSPTPYLRSRMAFSISAWRRWSRVPGSGVRGRGSGERETTASSLAGKQQAREKKDNGGQGKDGPAGAIAQGGNGR